MQEMSCYGCLMTTHAPEKTTSGTGANRLNSSASASDAGTTVIQHPAVEEKCFGICRVGGNQHSLYAHVNAYDAARGFRLSYFYFIIEEEPPLPSDALQPGILPSAFRQWTGIGYCQKLTPKSYPLLGTIEVSLPNYRQYRTRELSKSPTLVRFGCFVSGTDNLAERASKLRRESQLTKVGVVRLSQPIRVQLLSLEGNSRKPIGSFQPNDKQSISLRAARYFEFDCSNCFHYSNGTSNKNKSQEGTKE